MNHSMPGLPVHYQLLEFTQTHVHWVSDVIQPSYPLSSLLLLPSIFPSTRVFSNESGLRVRWPKYWSFSFNISPSSEHPGLISFRMDWLDLLAVQGTLKRLLQHHSSKASILWCSAFFIVQLSHSSEKEMALHSSTLLPGKSHGQRSLADFSPWGCYELDTTEWLHFTFHFHALEKEMATHSSVLVWRIPGMG